VTVCVKWAGLGRFQPGQTSFASVRFELWQQCRALLATADLVLLQRLRGSEWICIVLRAMGATVGANVSLWGHLFPESDLFVFEDGVAMGYKSLTQGHLINQGCLEHRRTNVRSHATVHAGASLLSGAVVGRDASVDAGALVLSGEIVGEGETWAGVPAARTYQP